MADGMFFVRRHLGKGAAVTFSGHKYWVVSKAAIASFGGRDCAVTHPMSDYFAAVHKHRHGNGAKPSGANSGQ